MGIIIAVSIAVIGWIANHLLTIRAQNKNFLKQLKATALSEILLAMKNYERWLLDVQGQTFPLKLAFIRTPVSPPVDWLAKYDEVSRVVFERKDSNAWMYLLEQYEIFFPQTAALRKALIVRHTELLRLGDELVSAVLDAPLGQDRLKEYLGKNNDRLRKAFITQCALLWDVRIHLQNQFLGPLTGSKAPEREPLDASLPRVVEDETGRLIIVPHDDLKDGSQAI